MKVSVLGCSGGINSDVATTSFLIDDDVLLDAGTGVCSLSIEQMQSIKHVFITHSHLDHVVSIPFLADTLFDNLIGRPLVVHALPETIKALRDHIFNWTIWPNFTELPDADNAVLKFEAMTPGSIIELSGRQFEMIRVNHAVPAVGYRVESAGKAFAFSGDTTTNDNFWASLNKHDILDMLFVESAFTNEDLELAAMAFHYCPTLLAKDLAKLKQKFKQKVKILISHLKPGSCETIMQQCHQALPEWDVQQLQTNDIFEL